jgi:hypothetical protein
MADHDRALSIMARRMKKRVHFTRVEPDRRLEFTFTNRLLSLIVPRLSFHLEPEDGGTKFEADIVIRTGPLGAWLNRREFDAVRQHMREEGENLKKLLESDAFAVSRPAAPRHPPAAELRPQDVQLPDAYDEPAL